MEPKEIATLKFDSVDLSNEGISIIRTVGRNIAVCLSVQQGGDAEVLISPEECKALIHALEKAIGAIE